MVRVQLDHFLKVHALAARHIPDGVARLHRVRLIALGVQIRIDPTCAVHRTRRMRGGIRGVHPARDLLVIGIQPGNLNPLIALRVSLLRGIRPLQERTVLKGGNLVAVGRSTHVEAIMRDHDKLRRSVGRLLRIARGLRSLHRAAEIGNVRAGQRAFAA